MKFMIFEGSTIEFMEVSPTLGLNTAPISGGRPSTLAHGEEVDENDEEFSVEQVKAVLGRRPVAGPMKEMLRLLYGAGDRRVSSNEIKKALKFNAHKFRGMLGAFGRRVKNTEGVPLGVKLLDEHWDHGLGEKTWSLPQNVRTAIDDLELL